MKLKLDGWDLGITFSACHFLPGHDKCNRLHGHNYALHLELEGDIGPDGMIHDFVELKRAMKAVADEMDHCVLMPGASSDISLERKDGQVNVISNGKRYSFPAGDVRVLPLKLVSAEYLAGYALDAIIGSLDPGGNVSSVAVGVDEGKGQGAWASRRL